VHIPRGGSQAKKVEENIRSVEEEVQLLQQFDHPNIVRYLVRGLGSRLAAACHAVLPAFARPVSSVWGAVGVG
jgi:hypothetical protein